MSGRTVDLTERLSSFVDDQVRIGRHHDASEVVHEALRRYEDALKADHARLEAIRDVVREGRAAIAEGDFKTIATPADRDAFLERLTADGSTGLSGM
ncbi:type II toxin-antitoxin system ParD family antitoxin [Acidisoma cladoniae]|jgi:antitoxin ParD1/3/4|uniref:type II toxin-antitoxin system ParD family antitoxin n=1 Tax=Acidisoma cladoniae TaxID=3040935 RepID=UPI0025501633|nr:type II toxin-antitoxin system ParD family antitoxin [Acidisoma sp. PAMC 29798]